MPETVLVVLPSPTVADAPADPVRADPAVPLLRVDDLGVSRGDGIFETVNAVGGHPQALGAHLARFARSAAMLDLPTPAAEVWRRAVHEAVAAHPPVPELLVKLVMTRGVEGSGRCSGWVLAFPNADATRVRTEGVAVLTLARGYPADVMTTAPWLLQGAKTLSYALNMAALRHARTKGADDAIFVSSEGEVLEAPTSSVVAQFGDRLVTPPCDLGILEGTCQGRVFAWARGRGLATAVERLTVDDLHRAGSLWLCSSGRLATPVRELDGVPRTWDAALHTEVLAHLLTVHE
ncbi:branched-chain amino acid aminotransferase [Pseudonocardia sp. CNS-139]|nr:branched-chain amino acid aminotransferase [Pseudonocardia sp. CNS-139]